IDSLNKEFKTKRKKFRILKSAEVNILKNGSLDISDSILSKLDVVGVAVHSNFKMSRKEMTNRITKALKNPHVDILFHPTGRLINQRPPYEVDMEQVIKAAKLYRVALEINAYPERSDLCDEYVRLAVKHGAKLVIDTDTHTPEHLRYIELGEAIARRGWAEKKDILNTLPVERLLAHFKK
ncbi:MAG: PHP domain-containing protein, partial [bacterium]|nr:PHP domain-containing protein [bacterium]